MTESVITVSPKTSPYRSQIHTRHASPGTSSAPGSYILPARHRHPDAHAVSNEKVQLRKLNDQFLTYIERVRLFETYNNCLTQHCEQIKSAQERTKVKLESLKQEFDEYQEEKFSREKKDIQLDHENVKEMEKQVNELKHKEKFFQHEHGLYRQQIVDLQQQSVDLQSKTEKLRYDYENSNDDSHHYRKQASYCQLLKSSILDEITRQRDMSQRLQLEVDELKIQKQIAVQAHEADSQAVEIHNDNMLYDLTTSFRFDGGGKNALTQMLNEIREEYKARDNEMRDELHRKYLLEYNHHIKKQVDQNLLETNREEIERRHLSNELSSLSDNRSLLRQKLTLVQEHYKQLEVNVEREMNRQKTMQQRYDQQINDLRVSVQDYENLLKSGTSMRQPTLEAEVNKYRQLLEGSDHQKGLRQLIHMSNKIEHFPPVSRPTTPPPPPPPASEIESASTLLLLLPPRTRQNSTSDTSYETALISQSTAPTANTPNQQYLTLDSSDDKLSHTDYDTDNDQSQTIQYMSGRSSRLTSATDTTPLVLTPTNQESLPPLPFTDLNHHEETVVEISMENSHTDGPINQTLPFVPMATVPPVDAEESKDIVSDEQQSPLISTLEQREEPEPTVTASPQTIIPITIDVDTKPEEEAVEIKIISPSTPTISADEQPKSSVSPASVPGPTEAETTAVEIPVATLLTTNPLAKLMSGMLPGATPFVPNGNGTANPAVSPTPIHISTMNNDAPAFVPSQPPQVGGQQHLNNANNGYWNGAGARGAGGNRRGQSGGGGFHHGGGNQRSGGGGNWQQGGGGGGGHQKPRRGMK